MDLSDPRSGTRQLVSEGASFSGNERNHLFIQSRSESRRQYGEYSIESGLDSVADGRSFAWLDYDRDGRRDVVLTNANAPRVNLYRNLMETGNHWVGIALEGGNRTDQKSSDWSNRDGVGATLRVGVGDRVEHLENRLGEGLAAQNGQLLLGLGPAEQVDWVEVQWPGGRQTRHEGPWPADQVLHLEENQGR